MADSGIDRADLAAAYAGTRAILHARDVDAAQEALLHLCRALGASVVEAEKAGVDAVPLDISLGDGDALLPVTSSDHVRSAISQYLAPAVSDARMVLERHLSSERLVESATRDPLTGLWNRRALTMAVNRARPGDCIALVDLDHFKSINDTLGHDAGDHVLAAFGTHLRSGLRDRDIVGRLGGEEFVIVFPATQVEEVRMVLDRLRGTWRSAAPQPITFSVGVATVTDSAGRSEKAGHEALQAADTLMYRAKDAGRDRIICAGD